MIKRVFDLDLLLRATDQPTVTSKPEDFKEWFSRPMNMMFADGEDVGIATYQYPGCYIVHWFFKSRGRKALTLGRAMVKNLFDNYDTEVVIGFIRENLKASRWAARQIGLKSRGLMRFADGEINEVFVTTKEEFLEGNNKWVE